MLTQSSSLPEEELGCGIREEVSFTKTITYQQEELVSSCRYGGHTQWFDPGFFTPRGLQ